MSKMNLIEQIWSAPRRIFPLLSILGLFLLLVCSFGCAPSATSDGGGQDESASSVTGDKPEITDEIINERINGTRVRKVTDEDGVTEPISWGFGRNEPKEIVVVEKQIEGNRATIVLDIKTRTSPEAREPRQLAGQIRTVWALQTGWMLRRWEIVNIENISMKYKNLPKPPAQNSNR